MKNGSMAVVLICTAVISALIIISVVAVTEPYIQRNKQKREYTGVLDLFEIPYTGQTYEKQFDEHVRKVSEGSYEFLIDGVVSGYAYKIEGMGFWGKISALIALSADRQQITGLTILEHNETPGLGGRITDPQFLSQFVGKTISSKIFIKSDADPSSPVEVDAITGATETSKALERMININRPLLLGQTEVDDGF